MDSSFDPQLSSKFISAPAEIRRAIYAHLIPSQIHLSLGEKGLLRLAPCVQHDNDGDADCINQRTNDAGLVVWRDVYARGPDPDPIQALRLRSSWGPHWRCEEQMRRGCSRESDRTVMSLLLVCKRMYTDIIETMVDLTAIQINDLETLSLLAPEGRGMLGSEPSSPTSVLSTYLLPNLKYLHITLRLPFSIYEALEHVPDFSSTSNSEPSLLSAWTDIRLTINEHLPKLRELRIWLDHDGLESWSLLNERAVLSPLASLSNNPRLQVSINLPKLHPRWESAERHFINDSSALPLIIHRRYRQRHHGIVNPRDGSLSIEEKGDFPAMYPLGNEEWMGTMEKVEEMERDEWAEGRDPTRIIDSFMSVHHIDPPA
ncbi:hypothetical protein BDV95DRAFT_612827 [Massariosphaeria phaeospora]|uniref:DUF7730 domain-containing protein n=1 Tax=Massariosphaeria phaeospora TaxID=100035 RepID=A0A7C8I2J9_9PLEO|nr:hypothetical protein BDV95DRAFT_612827 [Massariosphaeria phaeospora]